MHPDGVGCWRALYRLLRAAASPWAVAHLLAPLNQERRVIARNEAIARELGFERLPLMLRPEQGLFHLRALTIDVAVSIRFTPAV